MGMIEFTTVKSGRVIGTLDEATMSSDSPDIASMVRVRVGSGMTNDEVVELFSDWSNGYVKSRRTSEEKAFNPNQPRLPAGQPGGGRWGIRGIVNDILESPKRTPADLDVYWNLHKNVFSVRDRKSGRVIEHANGLNMERVRFTVSEAGRQRVIREKSKNVHAFVRGDYSKSQVPMPPKEELDRVTYNPYKGAYFTNAETGDIVEGSPLTWLVTEDGKGRIYVPKQRNLDAKALFLTDPEDDMWDYIEVAANWA